MPQSTNLYLNWPIFWPETLVMVAALVTLLVSFFFLFWLRGQVKGSSWKSRLTNLSALVLMVFCLELSAQVFWRIHFGQWLLITQFNTNDELFEPHPYLIGVNKKSINITQGGLTFSHNSEGFRGNEVQPKSNRIRIAVIGGSTTYGVGVNDWETWPYYLDSILGSEYEVINMGMPGHSTVEHLQFVSTVLPQYAPDVVIFHAGLNDLRSSHVRPLHADYSGFHSASLYGSLGLCYMNRYPRSAVLRTSVGIAQQAGWLPRCPYHSVKYEGDLNPAPDTILEALYRRNLESLVVIAHQHVDQVYFAPQVLNSNNFVDGNYSWWIPFLPDTVIADHAGRLNDITQEVATARAAKYIDGLDAEGWPQSWFSDPSHLNAEGNRRFAIIVGEAIENQMEDTLSAAPASSAPSVDPNVSDSTHR